MKSPALLLAALATLTTAALAENGAIGFARDPLGAPPESFTPMLTGPGQPGTWQVVADDDAKDGKGVEQSGADPTDDRFPLLAWRMVVPADVEVSTRIKPMSGRIDRAGGLAIRLLDQRNYYLVRANALEGNVRFYKVVDGRRVQLASADIPVKSGEWQELRLRAEGTRFAVSFNGRLLFDASDTAIRGPGRVAFWTKADSVTRFDSLSIRPIQR